MFKWFWTIFSLDAPVSAHALTLEAEIFYRFGVLCSQAVTTKWPN